MAEESFPFQELAHGDRTVSAAMFAKHLGMIRTRGVISGIDNALALSQSSPDAMSVDLAGGAAFVGLTQLRAYRNTLPRTLTIAAADPRNPRHDLVVLDMDTSIGPPDTRTVTATIVQGTPAASPTDPALTQTETHYQLALFRVRVGAAVASIVHTALTDRRAYSAANNTATVAPWLLSDSFASPPGRSGTPAANAGFFLPFHVPRDTAATKIRFHVQRSGASAYDLGIYTAAGARLVSLGATAVPAIGRAVADISDTPLAAGRYYLALSVNNTVSSFFMTRGSTDHVAMRIAAVHPLPARITPLPLNFSFGLHFILETTESPF